MKFLIVVAALISCGEAAISCNVADANGDLQVTECAGAETTCTSPVKGAGFAGLSEQAYGCGACPADSAATCVECDGTDGEATACNALVAVTSFTCFDYAWSADDSAWAQTSETAGTCVVAGAEADIACNKPDTEATAEYVVPNAGCGGCATDAAAGTCTACDKDACNSAATFTLILAPLVALLLSVM